MCSCKPWISQDYLTALAAASTTVSEIESPFQVQEFLTHLVAEDPHNVTGLVELPRWKNGSKSSRGKAREQVDNDKSNHIAKNESNGDDVKVDGKPDGDTEASETDDEAFIYVEREVWLYEHLRRLAIDLSHPFVVALQEHCSRETCPEMKAGEWLYLCAAHATANEVCLAMSIAQASRQLVFLITISSYPVRPNAARLITSLTPWKEPPLFSTPLDTSQAGSSSSFLMLFEVTIESCK